MDNNIHTSQARSPEKRPRRVVVWGVVAFSLMLLRCEKYYFSVDNGVDLPRFASTASGTTVEYVWQVTAYASNWSAVSRFYINFGAKNVDGSVDTSGDTGDGATGDTMDTSSGAYSVPTVQITFESEDGEVVTLERAPENRYDDLLLDLPLCDIEVGSCTQIVHMSIVSLTETPVSIDPEVYAAIQVPDGFCGPKDPDIQGLSISLEQVTE